jgi:hypothetical protein
MSCHLRRALVAWFSTFLLLLSDQMATAQDLTLDQLIERNVRATGGAAPIEAVQSVPLRETDL